MSDAWGKLPAFGSAVDATATEGIRQALLQSPVFSYGIFQSCERSPIVTVVGAVANVAETTVPLGPMVVVPANTCAIQYEIAVNSTATAAGTSFRLRHKPGGEDALTVEAQVVGLANYNTGVVAANSGQVTYVATKGSATAFAYDIWVTGFFRSY